MREINRTPLYPQTYFQIPNHEFTFSFIKDNQVLFSPVTCKDYLTDVIWGEITGKEYEVHGMKWKPGQYDASAEWHEMWVSGGAAKIGLRVGLSIFLNHFDTALGIPHSTVESVSDSEIIIRFHRDWLSAAPMVSALTSLVRIGGLYGEVGGPADPKAYLESFNPKAYTGQPYHVDPALMYMFVEVSRLSITRPRMKALLAGMRPVQEWTALTSGYEAHGGGIMGFNGWPEVEPELKKGEI